MARCIRHRSIEVERDRVVVYTRDGVLEISLGEVERIGVEKRYNRVLVAIVIAMGILTVATGEALYLLFLVIMLVTALVSRENTLVLSLRDGRLYRICDIGRKEIERLARVYRGSTH